MTELELRGCRPEPLMSYLKALGVLRLVAEQKDKKVRAAWRSNVLVLCTDLNNDAIVSFFLNEYRPTPIVAPWAGGSGFFEGDNKEAVEAIEQSTEARLQPYKEVIRQVKQILVTSGQTKKPTDDRKEHLLRLYRQALPDNFITWMDCAMVLQNDGQVFAPVLGTGGNDGRLDFTQNFMQRIVDLGLHDEPGRQAAQWLANALFDRVVAGLATNSVGQFDPGRVGGPNATQGMEGESTVNPWDFVLMIEGSLLLAGSVARRMGTTAQSRKALFPFTVAASAAGHESLSTSDSNPKNTRGEIWLPLWNRFASLSEVSLVFSEGRSQLGARNTRAGVDFARAIACLGVDRGFSSFTRFGFLKRSGKAYLATPLGRFDVCSNPRAEVLRELDNWLSGFRAACAQRNVPSRFVAALRCLDEAIFTFCRYGGQSRFAQILMAAGNIERELSRRADRPGVIGDRSISPLPPLSPQWIDACRDSAPEFRIALALASIGERGDVGPLRANLEPVQRAGRCFSWTEQSRSAVWSSANLCRNLVAVLTRRDMDARRCGLEALPLDASYAAPVADIAAFIQGALDGQRIEELLWGAVLVDQRNSGQSATSMPFAQTAAVPRAYALLKLLYMPSRDTFRTSDGKPIRPEPEILGSLRARDVAGACDLAVRRLRASGLMPMPGPTSDGRQRPADFCGDVDPLRLAAALLIPVADAAALKTLVLREPNRC